MKKFFKSPPSSQVNFLKNPNEILGVTVCHIAISNSNVDFTFHCIHATFLIQIHMYMMNTHGSEKTFGWIQTYDLQNSTTN